MELARKRRGLTKTVLARRAGLTTKSIYNYEAGIKKPSIDALTALAEVLRFPIAFFRQPDIEEPTANSASFRSLSRMTAGQRDSALAAGAMAFELSKWIEHRFELPEAQLPDLRDMDPEAAAMAIRDRWGIGERPIGNMIHLLESRGIRVFSLAEKGREVDAFSVWHDHQPFIFLNTMKTAEHSRFDASHELGHLLLHLHGTPSGPQVELEAQRFAAAFLMPRGSVLAHVPRLTTPTMAHLIQFKRIWKVSAAALANRLHRLRLITEWNYRRLCIEISRFGRTKEPDGIEREMSQIFAVVFGDLKTTGVTRSEVAKQLEWRIGDLEALVFGLSLAPGVGRPSINTEAAERRRSFRVV